MSPASDSGDPIASIPVSHINVWPDDEELVVTWRGGSEQVTVFVSDDPDDAGVDARAPDEPGRIVVGRGATRVYIHLFEPGRGFTVAAERRVDLDGPANFRDLGGYPTLDGAETRWGRVFRSDRLDGLSGGDHAVMGRLEIATVFDLRSAEEVSHAPDRLPPGVAHVHMPMSSDVPRQRSMVRRVVDGDLRKYDADDMTEGYLRMLEAFGRHFGEIVEAVADGHPILFHCTAGKDRTGLAAMLLLGLAGVADPHLLDDYEMTNRYRPGAHDGATVRGSPFDDLLAEHGLDPVDFETLWMAPRQVMRRTLDGLHDRWGDQAGYFRASGISDETAELARDTLRREIP